jgi:hypothetical protein
MDPRGVPEREFKSTIYSNLLVNLAKMILDNFVTDPELVSNLAILQSSGRQPDEA